MKHREASIALRRFGLGAKPGDLARVASDPRGYVLAALQKPAAALIVDADLDASHVLLAELRDAQKLVRDARKSAKVGEPGAAGPMKGAEGAEGALPPVSAKGADAPPLTKPGRVGREAFREDAKARLQRAVTTDAPFLERLVMFWSNHFAISAAKGAAVRVIAGAFEREAIRPHVLGRFADMLRAVEQHPAMLVYLDNAQSIGPNSRAGLNRGRGLNENLAREILELHTVGVNGGYSQADVTSFAKILTGWTIAAVDRPAPRNPRIAAQMPDVEPGRFVFVPIRHEPGPQTVLGKRYEDRGKESGEAVLNDLARHPSTARHIAMKLARHFVADAPPPELVKRLEETFRKSDGDLAAVARELVSFPSCWEMPARKVVPPYDFLVSIVRSLGIESRPPEMLRLAAAIGQPLWAPPSPKGWPDDDDAWMGPSAVRERLRIAERAARLVERGSDPRAVAASLFGDAMSDATRQAIARAEAREQGFELLVMSPEFLRR